MSLYSIWSDRGTSRARKSYVPSDLDKRILRIYTGQPEKELAEMFNRSTVTIHKRLKLLIDNGYIDPALRKSDRPPAWTEKEDRYLLNNFSHARISEISREMGRTEKAVLSRYYRITKGRS